MNYNEGTFKGSNDKSYCVDTYRRTYIYDIFLEGYFIIKDIIITIIKNWNHHISQCNRIQLLLPIDRVKLVRDEGRGA